MPLTLQLVDRGGIQSYTFDKSIRIAPTIPYVSRHFSMSPLLETEHVLCYNLVKSQKAMKTMYSQKIDLFAHS